MIKYRIFMACQSGHFYCPFNLDLIDESVIQHDYSPIYFDSIEQASDFIREHITSQKNRDYVILPVVSL
jgi:hypothetical protein